MVRPLWTWPPPHPCTGALPPLEWTLCTSAMLNSLHPGSANVCWPSPAAAAPTNLRWRFLTGRPAVWPPAAATFARLADTVAGGDEIVDGRTNLQPSWNACAADCVATPTCISFNWCAPCHSRQSIPEDTEESVHRRSHVPNAGVTTRRTTAPWTLMAMLGRTSHASSYTLSQRRSPRGYCRSAAATPSWGRQVGAQARLQSS